MVSRIAADESIQIRDRDLQLDSAFLNGLDEADQRLMPANKPVVMTGRLQTLTPTSRDRYPIGTDTHRPKTLYLFI